jgi:hypothetical protein
MNDQIQRATNSQWSEDERRSDENYTAQYNSSETYRQRSVVNSANAFGDFPPQMTATLDNTPQTTNRRADVQFAENSVLVLGGGGGGKNQRQSSLVNTPIATKLPGSNSLDYSMITTPGAAGLLESSDETNTTTLAASSGRWGTGTPFSNILRGVVSSTPGTDATVTPYTAARELLNQRHQTTIVESDAAHNIESTALAFAKSAPLSGYLRKLGRNIPTFKRRFFVLKPSTHLYYFISPNDVEPRGCIDLDTLRKDGSKSEGGCEVREIGSFPDGTFRFELLYDEETEPEDVSNNALDDNESDAASRSSQISRRRNFQRQSIVLEARTEEIGKQWMEKLQSERLSTARVELNSLRHSLEEMKSNINRWESAAYEEALRADEAERQRNTAISEARSWETKFINLNEAIRLLAKSSKQGKHEEQGGGTTDFLTNTIEDLEVNASNFGELSRTFHKILNEYNELSKKDDAVARRVEELEQRAKDAESRVVKAETELSKVVEENQTTQMELKKTKREKKILIREVKSLHAAAAKAQLDQQASSDAPSEQNQHDLCSSNSQHSGKACFARPNRINDEERRLVIELEEHVMSGLRLSDQFLTLNGIDPLEILDDLDSSVQASSVHDFKSNNDLSPQRLPINQKHEEALLDLSPVPGPRAGKEIFQRSLLDEKDDESDNDAAALVSTETKSSTPCYSIKDGGDQNNDVDGVNGMRKVGHSTHFPDLHNHAFQYEYASPNSDVVHQNLNARFIDTTRQREATTIYNTTQSTVHRKESSTDRAMPSLDMASSASESSRSRVTDNGLATAKLECPLSDVEETLHFNHHLNVGGDGNIYHITFYGSKIGLQFQKVPNESKSGLLTEAMTADHGPNIGGANQTAAELRRIASISQHTQTQQNKGDLSTVCFPATPADAVLVCGVVGFDESCGNTPPQIGGKSKTVFHFPDRR